MMEVNVVELAAQYGITGSLLLLVLYWLAKYYLPERDRQQRDALERVLANHEHNTNRLVDSVDRCARIVHFNSQALLVQGFTRQGLSTREAEGVVRRITAQSLDGLGRDWPPDMGAGGKGGA
jgi:hypothetical protein